jgi:hypothetical protein
VDYGGGPVVGAGVLARLTAEGEHVWTRVFDGGLYDVLPWGDDAVLVSEKAALVDGGKVYTRSRLRALGLDGCDRGAVDLGDLPRLRRGLDGSLLVYGLRVGDPPRLGASAVDVPPMQWWIARFTPDLSLAWVHTVACEGIEVAGGPRGEAAVSCFRSLSEGNPPRRRTLLLWVPGAS